MTDTGKKARREHGNRYAAKAARKRRPKRKQFGKLPFSTIGKTAAEFVRRNSGFILVNQ